MYVCIYVYVYVYIYPLVIYSGFASEPSLVIDTPYVANVFALSTTMGGGEIFPSSLFGASLFGGHPRSHRTFFPHRALPWGVHTYASKNFVPTKSCKFYKSPTAIVIPFKTCRVIKLCSYSTPPLWRLGFNCDFSRQIFTSVPGEFCPGKINFGRNSARGKFCPRA